MGKKKHSTRLMIGIGAAVAMVVIILVVAFFSITGSDTRIAFLNVEAGYVQVDIGEGWIEATDGMALSVKDRVKTGVDGTASLILYESAVISLDPGTEISIADLSDETAKVKQSSGSTWNKFTGLSGLRGLEVETPTTVATVRGTTFQVTMDYVMVGEGQVDVRDILTGQERTVAAGMKARMVEDELIVEDMSGTDRARMIESMRRHLEQMSSVREGELEKHPRTVSVIKMRYGLDDQGMRSRITDIDEGRLDEDDLVEKSPFEIASVDKFVAMTKQIKEQKRVLAEMTMEEDALAVEEGLGESDEPGSMSEVDVEV